MGAIDVDTDDDGKIDTTFLPVGTGASNVAAGDHTHIGVYEPAMTAASQAEMETGTEANIRSMSPLRVAQAIAYQAPATVSQVAAEAGTSSTVYSWTPERVAQAIAALAIGSGGWPTTALTAEPETPAANTIYLADCSTWDPITLGGSTAYWVLYDGSGWVGLLDVLGNWLISSLPAAVEVDGSASDTLTAVEMHGTVVSNAGQAVEDVTLTMPAAAAGLSALFQVGTAQAGSDWKVRAGTSDKIYVIAADGSVTAGSDNGYFGFAATAVGNCFAVWSFKSSASTYDWLAKAICGTCEAVAPA